MSWVISLVLAGLMISPGSNLSVNTNNNFVNANAPTVVSLDETERFEQTYPLNANGKVSVSNVNGSITVEAWDRNEVRLEAVKTADTKEHLAEVQIKINARQDAFSVETDYGSWRRGESGVWKNKNYGKLEVQYRLQVPRGAVLNEIETVNGSVTISNMTNSTTASAVNGNVRATNLRGTARISTVNGTTEADFDSLASTGQITLDTVNGKVILTIPSDASATVKADTLNGQIINDFGLPVRKGEYVGKDLYGKLGNGDLRIKLNSVNGDLMIKRKQDGKSVSPATNLLPQKNKADDDNDDDDDDEDKDDDDNSVNIVKMNKEITKAVKDAQKDSVKAIKLSEKELAKIQPELDKINAEAIKEAAKIANSDEMRERVREAQRAQRGALARMGEIGWIAPVMEKKTETFKVKGIPTVTVDAKDCPVTVKGWDKSEVQYVITSFSKAAKPFGYTVTQGEAQGESRVNIKVAEQATPPDGVVFGDSTRVRVEVYVPKKSNLRILSNREVRLENVSGDINVEGGEESVNVRDVDGKLRVATCIGSIRIIGFSGDLESKTINGAMNLEGSFDKINAQTADGTIVLTLPENANANIESNRKDIETDGISLVALGDKKDVSVWKVGNGGNNYRLYTTADGQVLVRSSNNLKTSF
jgi:DUF4097 and DUF4098 domain-containing protein YvlB